MKVSVCIATSRATTLPAAIQSIQRQTWDDWELVIIGQGWDQTAGSVVRQIGDNRVRYVHIGQHGLSRARNAGIAATTGEIIAMTDDDCEADAAWLETLVRCFREDRDVGLVGGTLLKPAQVRRGLAFCPDLRPVDAVYDPIASLQQPPPGWDWVGGNFSLRRHVIERVGPFDEYLGAGAPFQSAEDTDYKLRLEKLGVKMRSTPHALVHHTYGTRYGIRARLRHSRNYARGNGALAAKLTMLGDLRGPKWLEKTRRECVLEPIQQHRPERLPTTLFRLRHFTHGYTECMQNYRVDSTREILSPVWETAGELLKRVAS